MSIFKKKKPAGAPPTSAMGTIVADPIGRDALHPASRVPTKKKTRFPSLSKASLRKLLVKSSPAGASHEIRTTPVDASPGSPGSASGTGFGAGAGGAGGTTAAWYDERRPWENAGDEGMSGSGAPTAGTDSAGSSAETAAGLSAAADGTIPGSSYSEDLAASGPLAQLWEELKAGAAEMGLTLEEYADRMLENYPWLPAILGVTTGAALVALLYELTSEGVTGAATTGGTGKKKAKPKAKAKGGAKGKGGKKFTKTEVTRVNREARRLYHENANMTWQQAQKKAWADERGTIPRKGTPKKTAPKKAKAKPKGKGKLVKFKDKKTGKMVSFYAKK